MKTKLGVSVGLLAAAMYLFGLTSSTTVMLLISGYVLLFEKDPWLRNAAVKSLAICLVFQVIGAGLSVITDSLSMLRLSLSSFMSAILLITHFVSIVEKALFVALAFAALKRRTINIGPIDSLIAAHMSKPQEEPADSIA
jgi:membrane protease YdiL (CAAX protease family)